MSKYKGTVRERRGIDVFYEVEADSIQQAEEKLRSGETINETEVDGTYDIYDRDLREGPTLIKDEETETVTVSLFGPNANHAGMEEWAKKQQEWDYQSYMALRDLIDQIGHNRHLINVDDQEFQNAVKRAEFVSQSRWTASENLLRAINGQTPLELPKEPEYID